MTQTQMTAAQQRQAAQQQNSLATQLIRAQGLQMETPLAPVTLSPTVNNAGQVVNFTPRNVGLIKGFLIEVSAQVKNGNASAAIIPTNLNVANILSNVSFTDLQNTVRINCPAWQIILLNAIKQKAPFATAGTNGTTTDNPITFGSNTKGTVLSVANTDMIWNAPASIASGATGVVTFTFWVPLSYSDHDYRGAVYANVINGQMNLQFTVNPTPFYTSGGNQMLTAYGPADSATACSIFNTTIAVTQVYMDQLPIDPSTRVPVLPQMALNTIYELKNTTFTAAVPGNDFPMQYPNFRDIISSIVLMDNLAAPVSIGSFTNYFALQAANSTNIFKRDAVATNAYTRNILGYDLPNGGAYFTYRQKPLSTTQYGNLQLIFNGNSNWSASNAIYHCWESFASIQTISQAGSLAAS